MDSECRVMQMEISALSRTNGSSNLISLSKGDLSEKEYKISHRSTRTSLSNCLFQGGAKLVRGPY